MDFKKIIKVISAIVALAALAAAVVLAVKKLTGGSKEPEYFDDNEFFECDNEIEIVEAKAEETVVEEAPAKEAAPKKKAPAKKRLLKKLTLNNESQMLKGTVSRTSETVPSIFLSIIYDT